MSTFDGCSEGTDLHMMGTPRAAVFPPRLRYVLDCIASAPMRG